MVRHLTRTLLSGITLAAMLGITTVSTQAATLHMAWSQDATGLDPHKQTAFSSLRLLELIYEPLVRVDASLQIIPAIATSWEFSKDGKELTFKLDPKAKFQDGTAVTSADVKASFERILDESEALRSRIASCRRAVIIGAGFIGLEFAATARIKGLEVDVIELGTRVMARSVTAEVSDYFQERHAEAGVRIHLGVQATAIEGEGGKVTGVSLSDGRHFPADVVVVGVGVLPNVELAAEAGLPVASGIIVNDHLLTSDPDISAIGDCALFASPRFGGSLRVESVQNATDQARCVAARLTGDDKPYDGMPWFWSDQGDDKLQIAGLTTGYDSVVLRGDPAQKAFSAFCYKAGKLLGIESVNRAGDHMFGRRLLGMDRSLEPEKAADQGFDLKKALA